MNNQKSFFSSLFYNFLNKDRKELNRVVLSLFCIFILFVAGFFSYEIINFYVLFSNEDEGIKVIELKVPTSNIGITRSKLKSSENGGTKLMLSLYEKDITSMSISLQNNNSIVTYEVTVTSPDHKSYDLSESIYEKYMIS